jgi:hypothetical protein
VKEELPVLGIEAHDIGGQHIGGEIRRELQNFFAGMRLGGGLAVGCHSVITRNWVKDPLGRHARVRPPTHLEDRQEHTNWPGRTRRTRP